MSDLKTKAVTAQNTWTDSVTVGQNTIAYVRVGISGTTSNGSTVRLRYYDPDDSNSNYHYSDNVLVTDGQTYQVALVPGPAVFSAGCKTGEFSSGDNFTVQMRIALLEG